MLNWIRDIKVFTLAAGCIVAVGCNESPRATTSDGNAAESSTTTANRPVYPDNSATNIRDREDSAKSPIDQNENKTDIGITADIRSQVVDTKMSVNAQNVKIITQDGRVTLRGPVATAEEKTRIEEIAHSVAGVDKVDSLLEVTPQ